MIHIPRCGGPEAGDTMDPGRGAGPALPAPSSHWHITPAPWLPAPGQVGSEYSRLNFHLAYAQQQGSWGNGNGPWFGVWGLVLGEEDMGEGASDLGRAHS